MPMPRTSTPNAPDAPSQEERIERVDHLVSELQRRAFRIAAILARGSALTFQQYLALAHLGDHGPCAVNDLRSAMGIAQSTASELVTRLERGGFVTKDRDPRDARSLRIELAPKGREAVRKRRRAAKEFYKELLGGLPEGDQQEMITALETILKILPGAEPAKEELD
jgi:DNA-binding MarR family transcriptional regulator